MKHPVYITSKGITQAWRWYTFDDAANDLRKFLKGIV